jgi:hypothetical protein
MTDQMEFSTHKKWLDSVEKIVEHVTQQSIKELAEEQGDEPDDVYRELLEIYNSKRYVDPMNAADVVLYTVSFCDYRAEVLPSGEFILVSTLGNYN